MSRFYDALREARRQPGRSPAEDRASVPRNEAHFAFAEEPAIEAVEPPISTPMQSYMDQLLAETQGSSLSPDLLAPVELPKNGAPHVSLSSNEVPAASAQANVDLDVNITNTAPLLSNAADSIVLEHYRRLRTKLLQEHAKKPFRTLLVASPGPQEGKTVTILNLALSFGMLPSFKVLVVDGDLRRGGIRKMIGHPEAPGFADVIAGTAKLEDVLVKPRNMPVHFLLDGLAQAKVPHAELLNSSRLGPQFQKMANRFDLVLVDSPPINLLTDTHLLAGNCDAVLLVVRAYSTTRKALDQAMADLRGRRIVATVLNGGTRAQLYSRYNGYGDK